MTTSDDKEPQYFVVSSSWDCRNHYDDFVSKQKTSLAIKVVDGKCVDIINLNNDDAMRYMEKDPHAYGNVSANNVFSSDTITYCKKSAVLKRKLIGKDISYIQRAAPHICQLPESDIRSLKNYKCYHAKFEQVDEGKWLKLKDEEAHNLDFGKRIEKIRTIRKQRYDIEEITDPLADKARRLDENTEFVGFYEETPQAEHDKKAIARKKIYSKILSRKYNKELE